MLSSGHCPPVAYADARPTAICAGPNRAEYSYLSLSAIINWTKIKRTLSRKLFRPVIISLLVSILSVEGSFVHRRDIGSS